MIRSTMIDGTLWLRLVGVLIVIQLTVACGVPKQSVRDEADVIDKNAQTALALHAACLDGGADSQFCTAEAKRIESIRSSAQTLKDVAK